MAQANDSYESVERIVEKRFRNKPLQSVKSFSFTELIILIHLLNLLTIFILYGNVKN